MRWISGEHSAPQVSELVGGNALYGASPALRGKRENVIKVRPSFQRIFKADGFARRAEINEG